MHIPFYTIALLVSISLAFFSCKESPKQPEKIETQKTIVLNDTIYDSSFEWEALQTAFAHHYSNQKLAGFEKILENQTLLNVVYMGYDGKIHKGQLVCNQSIAGELKDIFNQLFQLQFPINSIRPISEFDFDDNRSMESNNTTCFDFRLKTRKNGLSKHAYGIAIDINPQQNPFVYRQKTLPENYDATLSTGKIRDKDSLGNQVIDLFKTHGWKWGGNWKSSKDYMHFEK